MPVLQRLFDTCKQYKATFLYFMFSSIDCYPNVCDDFVEQHQLFDMAHSLTVLINLQRSHDLLDPGPIVFVFGFELPSNFRGTYKQKNKGFNSSSFILSRVSLVTSASAKLCLRLFVTFDKLVLRGLRGTGSPPFELKQKTFTLNSFTNLTINVKNEFASVFFEFAKKSFKIGFCGALPLIAITSFRTASIPRSNSLTSPITISRVTCEAWSMPDNSWSKSSKCGNLSRIVATT
uniref:CSON009962 protein n=1 Tax=Culicoides sonorensis TaxID=179676 RepID=A0A336LKE3_CULSO